jgi:oligoendopeptidase F
MISGLIGVDSEAQASALHSRLTALHAKEPAQMDAAWLTQWSRLKCQVQTLWAEIFLATKRDSNDLAARDRYRHFMQAWVPRFDALDQLFAQQTVAQMDRSLRLSPNTSRQLAAELEEVSSSELHQLTAQEWGLFGEYDAVISNQEVDLGGTPLPIKAAYTQLAATTESPERRRIWEAIQRTQQADRPRLDALYIQLMQVRQEMARAAGAATYAEHSWQAAEREYTPQQALDYLAEIDQVFGEVMVRVDQERAAALGQSRLWPWDLTVALVPSASQPLTEGDYLALAQDCLNRLDPEFGALIPSLQAKGLLDLTPRPGKAGENAALHLMATGESAILCHLDGGVAGFRPLFHELGHALHSQGLSANSDNLFWDLVNFTETREFFAFVLQFLGSLTLLEHPALGEADRRWYQRFMVEDVTHRLQDINERLRLELWIYGQPDPPSLAGIETHYLEVYARPSVDWTDQQAALIQQWQKPQLFHRTFYNIDYSLAVVAALVFVRAYEERPAESLMLLKQAMRLGTVAGPSEIFALLQLDFPPSPDQIKLARDTVLRWMG